MAAALLSLFLLFASGVNSLSRPTQSRETTIHCGYQACSTPEKNKINVHLVPQTYDFEWNKAGFPSFEITVPNILSSVVEALLRNANRRFVFANTAFFWKWWSLQNAASRKQVRKLVQQGRLEFIGGGWSTNDEAVTHYQAIIDQMTWGLRLLNDTFGECGRPRVGWQIDPFGHSREMASILAQMGYDGLFLGHVHYNDKRQRLNQKEMEMVWQGSPSLGPAADLFTHILYTETDEPHDFYMDFLCSNFTVNDNDDKYSSLYRIKQKVNNLLETINHQSRHYLTNHIFVGVKMSSNFRYEDAETWYSNLEQVIRYVNANQDIGKKFNILYSTPNCYLKAVKDVNFIWTTFKNDFFPYASNAHNFWSGYYTSCPTRKYQAHIANNFLQICKQLFVLADLEQENKVLLDTFKEIVGALQNHEAITGTEKENKIKEYTRLLMDGLSKGSDITTRAFAKLMQRKNESRYYEVENCLQLNISQCHPSEQSKQFVVTIYNPLAQVTSPYVRFPVTKSAYTVQDDKGNYLLNQLVPIPDIVKRIRGRNSSATHELVFRAENLNPLSFNSYFVSKIKLEKLKKIRIPNGSIIPNNKIKVIETNTGNVLLSLLTHGAEVRLTLSYSFYESIQDEYGSSDAYVMRAGQKRNLINFKPYNKDFEGPLVHEFHGQYNWINHVVRRYAGEEHVEVEWLVGPIPIRDRFGKEVIVRYTSHLSSQGIFFTDSNGRELIKRIRKVSPYASKSNKTVSQNYYPVTTQILLRDYKEMKELCILVDRAQGGSSLQDGEIELMLHRRVLYDDGIRMDEELNETSFRKGHIVRGKHFIIGGLIGHELSSYEKKLAQEKYNPPWMFFTRADGETFTSWSEEFKTKFEGVKKSLPNNVHILTLEPWKEKSLLLRLEHILEIGEVTDQSTSVTVQLKDLFVPFDIISVRETTLGANQWKEDSVRLQWNAEAENTTMGETVPETSCKFIKSHFSVELKPMQICTFVIEVKHTEKEVIVQLE